MKIFNKKNIVIIIISFWIILWVNFIFRDLYKHGYLEDYKILARSDTEGKYAHTYGKSLYEFLKFAKNNMPKGAHYEFIGIESLSLDSRRAIYYLYPCIKRKDASYILVYNVPNFRKDGFHIFDRLDNARFILKID